MEPLLFPRLIGSILRLLFEVEIKITFISPQQERSFKYSHFCEQQPIGCCFIKSFDSAKCSNTDVNCFATPSAKSSNDQGPSTFGFKIQVDNTILISCNLQILHSIFCRCEWRMYSNAYATFTHNWLFITSFQPTCVFKYTCYVLTHCKLQSITSFTTCMLFKFK